MTSQMRKSKHDERGAVAIMVAMALTAMLLVVGMILDFGQARLDRQANKSAADAAVAAGMRGLDGGDGQVYSYRGVCKALEYLKQNTAPALDGLPNSNPWSGCDQGAPTWDTKCVPGDPATYAEYSGSVDGYDVRIQSPHAIDATEFPEESLAALAGDQGDPTKQGCDQLGVVVTQSRQPGIGSLAGSEDLVSTIRSVGRVNDDVKNEAGVALLLLEQHDCQALNADGLNSHIRVEGFNESPGMIHADSLGDGDLCNSGNKVLNGNHFEGIFAGQSEVDPKVAGVISTVALSGGVGAVAANATDPDPEVVVDPGGAPTGRELVTRSVVDERYLYGVGLARDTANSALGLNPTTADAAGWKVIGCNPTGAALGAISDLDSVYVDCNTGPGWNKANVTIPGWRVVFNGSVKATNLKLPNAERVYIEGESGTGLDAGGNFSMHNYGAAACSDLPEASTAQLVIRNGALKATGGLLQMCKTTLIMMGGYADACLPLTTGTAPTDKPCGPGVAAGDGVVTISGGASQDWTAPNTTSDKADPAKWDQLEDLAMWAETYGFGPDYQMAGSGNMHLSGVFMAPNANPFNIKGGGYQDVKNSSYVARKLNVTGNGTLFMKPNPNDIVTLPVLGGFELVR